MDRRSTALIMHGWGKSKSHRPLVELSKALMNAGVVDSTLRFDFTGHGESVKASQEANIIQFLSDAEEAFDSLITSQRMSSEKVVLIGHSIGALIAILLHLRLRKTGPLILISPAIQQRELIRQWYSEDEIALCSKQGYLDTPKGRVGWQYFKEALNYDWLKKVALVHTATLVIHGSVDKDVPSEFVRDVCEKLGAWERSFYVKDAEHNFESHQAKDELIKHSLAWLKEHL